MHLALAEAMLSIPHMIVIFVVVLVVFGPQKLPELARGLGKLMAELRKASTDFRSAFEQEMHDLDRQAREAEWKKSQPASPAAASPDATPPPDTAAAEESSTSTGRAPGPETVARSAELSQPVAESSSENELVHEAPSTAPSDDAESTHGHP